MEITQRMSIKGVAISGNQIEVHVENIKCGGCENSIVKGLNSIEGLSNIVIDRVSGVAPRSQVGPNKLFAVSHARPQRS